MDNSGHKTAKEGFKTDSMSILEKVSEIKRLSERSTLSIEPINSLISI